MSLIVPTLRVGMPVLGAPAPRNLPPERSSTGFPRRSVKGIAASSLAAILEARGLRVSMTKLDPYINVDPGTMSPLLIVPTLRVGMPVLGAPAPRNLPPERSSTGVPTPERGNHHNVIYVNARRFLAPDG